MNPYPHAEPQAWFDPTASTIFWKGHRITEDSLKEMRINAIDYRTSNDNIRQMFPYSARLKKVCPVHKKPEGYVFTWARTKPLPVGYPIQVIWFDGDSRLWAHYNSEEVELFIPKDSPLHPAHNKT